MDNRVKKWKDIRDYLYGPIKPPREPYYTKDEAAKIGTISAVAGLLVGSLFTTLFLVL